MAPPQQRHDDIVIQRRFGAYQPTRPIKQVYAVTYPGHTDDGTERASYDEAEQIALSLAEVHGLSVWYEENPQSGRRMLVRSFRGSGEITSKPGVGVGRVRRSLPNRTTSNGDEGIIMAHKTACG